jgi:hypothetical protein
VSSWKSYPDETWDQYVNASKSTRQRRTEQKGIEAHIDNVGILTSSTPWPESKVQSQVFSGYTVKAPFDIYSEQEFRDHFNVSMDSMGLKCNHEITNQFGKPESVLLVRSGRPRQLEAYTFTGTLLDVSRMSQRVREFQPEAQFAHEVNQELEACPYRPGSKRRLVTADKLKRMVKKHMKALEKGEVDDGDGQESPEEEMEPEGPTFFRRGSKAAKPKKVDKKGKHASKKAASKAKGASARTSRGGAGSVGAAAALGSDLQRKSGGAASVVSLGRRSIPSASLCGAADGGGGVGAAASSRSTVACDADIKDKGTFYFSFQSIVEGTTDRNALNGVFVA